MSARQPLSVFIITHNEAHNLPRALASVAWADERLVVDSGSSDGTVELARAAGARVEQRPWTGSFGEYKEMALRLCTHRWVLLLDADEEVTRAQREFIERLLAADPAERAVAFRRRAYFGKQWIRGLGWWPDYVVRLFPADRGRFSPDKVHERVIVEVPVEHRPEAFNHYSYRDEADFRARSERYARLWADTAAARGKRPVWFPALRGWLTFLRCYCLRYGFIDGRNGLLLSRLYGEYARRKYELLRERVSPSPSGRGSRAAAGASARSRSGRCVGMVMTVIVRVPNWLGDCVISLPALRAIRAAHRDDELLVLAHRGVADFYRCLPEVDEVREFDLKDRTGQREAVAFLRRHHRAARGYLFVNSLSGAWQFWRAGLRERIGFARGFNRWLLTRAVDDTSFCKQHQVQRYLGLVAAVTGVAGDSGDFFVTPPQAARDKAQQLLANTPSTERGYFIVHPGAQYGPAKRWPPERFSAAVQAITASTGLVPVIVAGPRDAGEIACPAEGIDLSGKTSLAVLLALMQKARFALVNDSGPMHLAAAAGTKVVALFLSTDPGATAPLGEGHQLLTADVPCRPCFRRTCPHGHYRCHTAVDVRAVVAAARILGEGGK